MKAKYARALLESIKVAMKDTPVVLINGPRQSGKTTLVQQYAPSLPYVTLDDDNVLNAVLNDPVGFINHFDKGIIDEVQRAPGLLRAIKLAVDRDRKPGKFLLTGSANLLAFPQIGDSLAGRMEILTLLPLSLAEIEQRKNNFLHYVQNKNWPLTTSKGNKVDYISKILVGGYPEMLSRQDPARRNAWAKAYIKAIIERDVKDIASVDKLAQMPHLLDVLAQQSGNLTNFTKIGGQLNLDVKTTQKYVALLENLFLIKRLYPWHSNTLSRLVKTPKLHFLDSGLLASVNRMTLAGINTDKSLIGSLLETWVYSELLKAMSVSPEPWNIYHYRDKDQFEVDFVLETHDRQVIGIEVKASSTVFSHDFRGINKLARIAGKYWGSGIVLYDGDYCLSFGDNLWAVPFSLLG